VTLMLRVSLLATVAKFFARLVGGLEGPTWH
jgi:hypothetical protein